MTNDQYISEIWYLIPSAPNYSASSKGRIRREVGGSGTKAGKILAQARKSTGRAQVSISQNGKIKAAHVHRLVAEAFFGLPPEGKPFVCHKDGNCLSNVPENLYYGNARDNGADAIAHGTIANGERNGNSKLTEQQAHSILSDQRSVAVIAKDYGINITTVYRLRKKQGWRHL